MPNALVLLFPFGLVAQLAAVGGYALSRRNRAWTRAAAATSVLAACGALSWVAASLQMTDPGACAPLGQLAVDILSVALTLTLAAAATAAARCAREATRGGRVLAPVAFELSAVAVAALLFGWLAAGTSC